AWFLLGRAEMQHQLRIRGQRDWEPFQRILQDAKRALEKLDKRDERLLVEAEILLVEAEATAAQGSLEEAARLLSKSVQANAKRILPEAVLNYERWGFPEQANAAVAELRQLGAKERFDIVTTEVDLLVLRKQLAAAQRLLEESTKQAEPRQAAEYL